MTICIHGNGKPSATCKRPAALGCDPALGCADGLLDCAACEHPTHRGPCETRVLDIDGDLITKRPCDCEAPS